MSEFKIGDLIHCNLASIVDEVGLLSAENIEFYKNYFSKCRLATFDDCVPGTRRLEKSLNHLAATLAGKTDNIRPKPNVADRLFDQFYVELKKYQTYASQLEQCA